MHPLNRKVLSGYDGLRLNVQRRSNLGRRSLKAKTFIIKMVSVVIMARATFKSSVNLPMVRSTVVATRSLRVDDE
jgi:hypothetical protein